MSFSLRLAAGGIVERPLLLPPSVDTHKYARGHAVLFSGPALQTGAIRLSARAALAVGSGVVTIAADRDALREHASHVTAIMLREVPMMLDERVTALAIGPAFGIHSATRERVLDLLARKIPIVLDADALTSFADDSSELFAALHDKAVLTPHQGEFVRLFPQVSLVDRKQAAQEAAMRCGAVVLLKGAITKIAGPDGQGAINRHGSPWLATAGSGDVLTGMICGLLAQGLPSFDAAAIGAWLHGDVGVRFGPGLVADIMPDQIPLVLQDCIANG